MSQIIGIAMKRLLRWTPSKAEKENSEDIKKKEMKVKYQTITCHCSISGCSTNSCNCHKVGVGCKKECWCTICYNEETTLASKSPNKKKKTSSPNVARKLDLSSPKRSPRKSPKRKSPKKSPNVPRKRKPEAEEIVEDEVRTPEKKAKTTSPKIPESIQIHFNEESDYFRVASNYTFGDLLRDAATHWHLRHLIPENLRSSESQEEGTHDQSRFIEIRNMDDHLLPYSALISTVYLEQLQQKKRTKSKPFEVKLKVVQRPQIEVTIPQEDPPTTEESNQDQSLDEAESVEITTIHSFDASQQENNETSYIKMLKEGGTKIVVDVSELGGHKILRVCKQFSISEDGRLYKCKVSDSVAIFTPLAVPEQAKTETFIRCDATEELIVAISENGTVWVWIEKTLDGFCSQIGKLKAVEVTCEGKSFQVLANNGSVYRHPGSLDPSHFKLLPSTEAIRSIASGQYHSLLVTQTGKVYAYGHGGDGKLGLGDSVDHLNDIQLITSLNSVVITSVACGLFHSLAISDTGKLYSWGHGKYGQLGHRCQQGELKPKLVEDIPNRVVSVVASTFYTAVLTVDGQVYTFGIGMTPRQESSGYNMNALSAIPCLAFKDQTTTQIGSWDRALVCLEGTIYGTKDLPIDV